MMKNLLKYSGKDLSKMGNAVDKCLLVERGYMYDVYINGKFIAKGQKHYISTAYYFYKSEGFDVEIVYE